MDPRLVLSKVGCLLGRVEVLNLIPCGNLRVEGLGGVHEQAAVARRLARPQLLVAVLRDVVVVQVAWYTGENTC